MDQDLLTLLACPRDGEKLFVEGTALVCDNGHRFPIVEGIPVLLLDDVEQTIGIARASLQLARGEVADDVRAPGLYLPSVGISDEEKNGVVELARRNSAIDPVVAQLVAATNGLMYKHLAGSLPSYPIPDIPLGDGTAKRLLDVGCSWGRWSIAAARKGYRVVGIDPSLGAIKAAERVARNLNVSASFVVGDARFLPFNDSSFDVIYSYSVVQHLSRRDAERVIEQVGRALVPGGTALVQMPTSFGLRCLYHQWRRFFREAEGFGVRYWRLRALCGLFEKAIGATEFSADCFFGIGLQKSDLQLMPISRRALIYASEFLKWITRYMPALLHVTDSVFVRATQTRKVS